MQQHRVRAVLTVAAIALAVWSATATTSWAQLEVFPGLGGNSGLDAPVPVTATAVFTDPAAGAPGRLVVTAQMASGWNIYSITQPDGGQVRTQIKVAPSDKYRVGPFTSIEKPTIHPEPAFDNLLVEEHRGSVTWVAPLELSPGVDLQTLEITGSVYAQACNNVCMIPTDYAFTAKLGTSDAKLPAVASAAPPVATTLPSVDAANVHEGMFQPPFSHLTWQGKLEPAQVAPGGRSLLLLTAEMAPQWHVYDVDAPQKSGNQPTLFFLTETGGLTVGRRLADRAPIPAHGTASMPGTKLLPFYEGQMTWAIEIKVPPGTAPGEYRLAGAIGFQTCNRNTLCDPPGAVQFETSLTVGDAGGAASRPIRFLGGGEVRYSMVSNLVAGVTVTAPSRSAETGTAAGSGYDITQLQVQSQSAASPLPVMLGIGLLAGFILNFMPCVLPVIGLKVLSFVEQGGHDRRRVFMLNLWYSLGILSVFWILATIPVVLRIFFDTTFGWGQQFSYVGFNITLVAVVFVMALSFLGVWEIPIPGFAGSGGAQKASRQEGFVGAFAKGMITTVLATPCSGPFLGTAVAFALTASTVVTYAMFTAMGLGMAAPYLLIGLQPQLIRFLPKPGEWMDTFKQLMGFVLIGTVLWLMVPIDETKLMPTLVLLAGLAAGCWWIGRTPGYAELPQKLRAWTEAALFSGAVGWLAFAMPQVNDPLPWRHFQMADFVRDVNDGKTVLVEFTADWCPTCKALKAAVLDRTKTKQYVADYGVVVYEMNIDRTTLEERAFFDHLQPITKSVPLIAIFPAGKKYEPIRFGDGYTQSQILGALDEAGPSRSTTHVANQPGVRLGMQ